MRLAPWLLVLLACSGAADPRGVVEVRDSAGVRIVHSAGPLWSGDAGWKVAPSPDLVIGKADGEDADILYRTGAALRLRTGEILVTQSASPPRLRIYDEDGVHVRSFGGEGEGPGEFRLLMTVCASGDTLIAYDVGQGRLTMFTAAGEVVEVRRLAPDLVGAPGMRNDALVWMEAFGDCDFLGRANSVRPEEPGAATFAFVRLELEDLGIDTVAVVTGGEWVAGPAGRAPTAVRGASIPWAVAGDSTVFVSDAGDFRVREFSKSGALLKRFGRAHEAVPITDGEIRRLEERELERAGPASVAAVRERQAAAVYASAWPAHTRRMLVDREGNLWIEHFVPPLEEPGPEDVWTVFGTAGVFLGEVRTPAPLRITEIGDDYVLGIWRDSLDVESVRRFTLEKR